MKSSSSDSADAERKGDRVGITVIVGAEWTGSWRAENVAIGDGGKLLLLLLQLQLINGVGNYQRNENGGDGWAAQRSD